MYFYDEINRQPLYVHGSGKVARRAQRLAYAMPEANPVDGVGGQKRRGAAFFGESFRQKGGSAANASCGGPGVGLGLSALGFVK